VLALEAIAGLIAVYASTCCLAWRDGTASNWEVPEVRAGGTCQDAREGETARDGVQPTPRVPERLGFYQGGLSNHDRVPGSGCSARLRA
jgi:hypothetical protein